MCAKSFTEVNSTAVTHLDNLHHCYLSTWAHQITALQQQNLNKAKFLLQRNPDIYISNAEKASYFYQNILFWKAQENGICDQQYAICNKLFFLQDYISLKQLWGLFEVRFCQNKPVPTILLHFFGRCEVSCQGTGTEMEMDVLLEMLM